LSWPLRACFGRSTRPPEKGASPSDAAHFRGSGRSSGRFLGTVAIVLISLTWRLPCVWPPTGDLDPREAPDASGTISQRRYYLHLASSIIFKRFAKIAHKQILIPQPPSGQSLRVSPGLPELPTSNRHVAVSHRMATAAPPCESAHVRIPYAAYACPSWSRTLGAHAPCPRSQAPALIRDDGGSPGEASLPSH
jgi:hypothetical protein